MRFDSQTVKPANPLADLSPRERLVLETVRRQGRTTRAQLMQKTELLGPAVFRATEELEKRGLLLVGAPVVSGRGQPSHSVELRADAQASFGLAVMTDHAEMVLMDFTGAVRSKESFVGSRMTRSEIFAHARGFLDRSIPQTGISRDVVIGAELAIAGYFTGEPGAINPAAELDDWALRDLRPEAEEALGLPVGIENIANAAALGERLLGIGQRVKNFAYLNFSHGFGAGLIIENELARGRFGNAGELGGLLQLFKLPSPSLAGLKIYLDKRGIVTTSIVDLVSRFDPTWPGIDSWVADYAPSLSHVANALRYILDCDVIVLGGMMPPALGRRLIEKIEWLEEKSSPRRGVGWPSPQIVCAEVTTFAAATGAASSVLQRACFL